MQNVSNSRSVIFSLVMGWNISPAHAAGLSPAHSIWAGSGPTQNGWAGSGPTQNGWAGSGPVFYFILLKKRKKFKNIFWNFYIFPCIFYVILINIKQYFYVAKNTKFDIKILGFRQNFQNTKKFEKKMFLCIRPSVSKLKNHSVFYTPKNNVLACILALITSLLKSREHWLKFQKQQKFYFVCLLVSGVRY